MYNADKGDFSSPTTVENRMLRLYEEQCYEIDMSGIAWMAPSVARRFVECAQTYDFTLYNVDPELRMLFEVYGAHDIYGSVK